MQTDRPILTAAEDKFDRAPFAKRIAEVIRSRSDSSTLIIGLYGPWGDGKSSTLALVKEALGTSEGVIQVDYNPWFFSSSTENLTKSFFLTFAETLEKTGLFSRENIGGLLKKYGGMVPKFGSAIKAAGEALSTINLKAIRSQVETILNKHKIPIVVFIDDIDRLDRKEIQLLFKLIRLTADFPYVIYVLAFDDEIVAAALGEAYEGGDAAAGRRFLEKIVQSPLHMPRAKPESLRRMVFEAVDRIIKTNGITLTEQQTYAFANNFALSFEPLMRTPRQAKLYENALTFAAPILKGEVNIVDLLLIEGLRTFVPKVYMAIRDNPDLFLKARDVRRVVESRLNKVLDESFDESGIEVDDRAALRNHVLVKLFPRISDMIYGDEWDQIWSKDKHACASDYFSRYFYYGVPTGDIPDQLVDQVVADAVAANERALADQFKRVEAQSAYSTFIRKLRRREESITPDALVPLIRAIAIAAKALPREPSSMISDWTIMQAAILTAHLAQRLPTSAERLDAIQAAIHLSTSYIYSVEIFRWTHRDEEEEKGRGFLEKEEISHLTAILIERILADAKGEPLYRFLGDDTSRVLLPWSWYGDQDRLKANVVASIEKEGADGAEALIQACCGRSWEMSSGIPHISDVSKNVYQTISNFVNPEIVMTVLRARYGAKLDGSEFHIDSYVPLGERLARQFAFIHLKPPSDIDGKNDD